jgi:hypothetical protein
MAEHLSNDDLIRQLCMDYEQTKIVAGNSGYCEYFDELQPRGSCVLILV